MNDWSKWILVQPLSYSDITVPSGIPTDGASIPRILWNILPSWDRYGKAAVVHDYLYRLLRENRPHPSAPTRKVADATLYEAMVDTGVNTTVRWVMWAAVRLFGWMSV